mmetsp:Transcript_3340/g.6977  ORF Transcript_3340/g.6977 Transcript_3340/m.6977 type:complete len:202 (-) Transcript_3340:188-793(-)|eukprot:CAMPEP_0168740364 /NCGR_PEP_ID=MMETSP0724-20121128/11944_1 /TAXON_ID=265536 /ORGANISM="Amphiprora sp., Strain CCMP467" /LENGTH=201 /DNA_ID=CAMNT_0008787803 /DNA_START=51 /DNA_END=656 /DNA_ORIENTATION=+
MWTPLRCLLLAAVAFPWAVRAWTPSFNNNAEKASVKPKTPATAWGVGAAAAAGWIFSAQVALADPFVNDNSMTPPPPMDTTTQTTMLLAAGAYQPEDSFASLDMTMPSYGSVKDSAELLGAPSKSAPAPKKIKASGNPEKDAERQAKAEAIAVQKAAKAREEARARADKAALVQAKMDAKKAERAAMQSKRAEALASTKEE